jgi:hypothetical protein
LLLTLNVSVISVMIIRAAAPPGRSAPAHAVWSGGRARLAGIDHTGPICTVAFV